MAMKTPKLSDHLNKNCRELLGDATGNLQSSLSHFALNQHKSSTY